MTVADGLCAGFSVLPRGTLGDLRQAAGSAGRFPPADPG
jgi:hypothetical protein